MNLSIKQLFSSRYLLWMLLALPFLWLVAAFLQGKIFYGEMLHASGEFSARLLIIVMAVSALRLFFPTARWSAWLLVNRRYFGVASFFYALLHAVVYLEKKQNITAVAQEALQFEMWTGWVALFIFFLLALTSNNTALRVMRSAWKKLHRLVYLAALLTFVHWIFSAFDFIPGVIHLLLLLAIESVRVIKLRATKMS
jgi:sulfoxide reductase heme-binding subunit YedZ